MSLDRHLRRKESPFPDILGGDESTRSSNTSSNANSSNCTAGRGREEDDTVSIASVATQRVRNSAFSYAAFPDILARNQNGNDETDNSKQNHKETSAKSSTRSSSAGLERHLSGSSQQKQRPNEEEETSSFPTARGTLHTAATPQATPAYAESTLPVLQAELHAIPQDAANPYTESERMDLYQHGYETKKKNQALSTSRGALVATPSSLEVEEEIEFNPSEVPQPPSTRSSISTDTSMSSSLAAASQSPSTHSQQLQADNSTTSVVEEGEEENQDSKLSQKALPPAPSPHSVTPKAVEEQKEEAAMECEEEEGVRQIPNIAAANLDKRDDKREANALDPAVQGSSMTATSFFSLAQTVVPGVSQRTDYPLLATKMALIVIDIQDYLSVPASSQDQEQRDFFYNRALPKTLQNVELLLRATRTNRDSGCFPAGGSEVIFTYLQALTNDNRDLSLDYKLSGPALAQHLPTPLEPATFLPNIQPNVAKGKGDILVPKTSCSVFQSTSLDYILRNLHIEQIVLCGQLTDQCVESAARDAADLGYFVTVAEDACAADSLENHSKGLSGMDGFCRILTTQQVLEELQHQRPQEQQHGGYRQGMLTKEQTEARQRSVMEIDVKKDKKKKKKDKKTQLLPLSIQSAKEFEPSQRHADPPETLLAFFRALKVSGVDFLRYTTVDVCNAIRCKAIPISSILDHRPDPCDEIRQLDKQVSIAKVCMAGLPSFGDSVVEETELDARHVLTVRPEFPTLRILPYAKKTACVMGTVHDSTSGELSSLCCRGLLARVIETAARNFQLAFTVGAELEFGLFCEIDSNESTKSPPIVPVDQSMFGHATTLNQQEAFIGDLYVQLSQQMIDVELIHAESGPGQMEVVLCKQDDVMKLADHVVLARETVKALARAHKMRAVFLPKMFPQKAGNGMHLHFSFRDLYIDKNDNAFYNSFQKTEVSAKGKSFMEGILQHIPALLSLTVPSVNSFRRVGPGCWTGSRICWAVDDKEAPLRVCLDLKTGHATNVEFKLSDSQANIYLELAALLAAGLDGISQSLQLRKCYSKKNPGDPLPATFQESMECLKKDKLLMSIMGTQLSTGYLALRAAEAKQAENMTLEQELWFAYEAA